MVQEKLEESVLVIIVNHPISEYTLVFMDPKFDDAQFVIASLEVSSTYALEDFAHITQVERIVRLVGGRFECLLDFVVDISGSIDNFVYAVADFLTGLSQETIQNRLKNRLD